MGQLKIKDKEIVIPGDIVASGMDFLPSQGTFREGDEIISSNIGIASVNGRVIKVIPLTGKYNPRPGDMVIGKIIDMSLTNWYVDIGCVNNAALSIREVPEYIEIGEDLSQHYTFGDYIVAKITKVNRNIIDLTLKDQGLRKLGSGKLIKVSTSKVPRIIGKQGSMISILKEKTKCRITVGKNGLVWIQGDSEDERFATEAIQRIDENSHKEGLTENINNFLDSKKSVGEKKDEKK